MLQFLLPVVAATLLDRFSVQHYKSVEAPFDLKTDLQLRCILQSKEKENLFQLTISCAPHTQISRIELYDLSTRKSSTLKSLSFKDTTVAPKPIFLTRGLQGEITKASYFFNIPLICCDDGSYWSFELVNYSNPILLLTRFNFATSAQLERWSLNDVTKEFELRANRITITNRRLTSTAPVTAEKALKAERELRAESLPAFHSLQNLITPASFKVNGVELFKLLTPPVHFNNVVQLCRNMVTKKGKLLKKGAVLTEMDIGKDYYRFYDSCDKLHLVPVASVK